MKILKIYNNNVVSCCNRKGEEMIMTGAGIGFHKKPGDRIDERKITQQFYLEDDKKNKIYQLLERVPSEYFQLSEDILLRAKKELGKKFNLSTFIPFTDHLAAAIERAKNDISLPNLILMEIKTIWKREFIFSLWVLEYIEEKTGHMLSIDEAGYFAMYFVNDTEESKASKSLELIQVVTDIVEIIETSFELTLDRQSLSYMRLVTHLRFFVGRIKNGETRNDTMNEGIYRMLIHDNPRLEECQKRISEYIKKELNYIESKAEIVYLMIHITQILGKQDCN